MPENDTQLGLVWIGENFSDCIQLLTAEQVLQLPIGKLVWNIYGDRSIIRNKRYRSECAATPWYTNTAFTCWGVCVVPAGLEDEEVIPA
jgi:hypothetical protein